MQEARLKAAGHEIVPKEKGGGDAVGKRTGSITGQGNGGRGMNTPFHLPASTIDALEYVVDRAPDRLKDFLVGRSEAEKEAMRQHLRKRAMEKKKKEAADSVEDERRRIIGGLAYKRYHPVRHDCAG
jgi:hypothetical protein